MIKTVGISYFSIAIMQLEGIFKKEEPDCILILGDTNSAFASALVAKKMGIKIFHMEAGNRCFDNKRVPEEVNRNMIDSIADWHLTYTQRSREHLLFEGHKPNKVIVVGNPISEIIYNLNKENKIKFNETKEEYYLVTIHRKENMEARRLTQIIAQLGLLNKKIKISKHPTLESNLKKITIPIPKNIDFFTPSNFEDFINLEVNSECIITDSGTIPEEASILQKPCVLLRYSTERPELLENNSMILCSNPYNIKKSIEIVMGESGPFANKGVYHNHTSGNIVKILMRYQDD